MKHLKKAFLLFISIFLTLGLFSCKTEEETNNLLALALMNANTTKQYTVTFNANDGSASPATATQVFTAGTAQALKTAATLGFSKANYTFAGWATSKEASSAAYADGASYTATADVTLYAVWTAITYTVTFNANDGSANPLTGSQTFTAGSAQALKTAATLGFSKTNYAFAGWATSKEASSSAYADGALYTATADITLYAVWKTIDYTVIFNANDGSASPATATQGFTAGTAQALKKAATLGFSRANYTFAGWATTNNATSAAYADGVSYTATENVTLYAVWTLITYTVTFKANDGSQSPATGTQTFTAGSAQTLKTAATLGFSRANYTFAGWATTNNATSATLADGASYTATGNVTLYAVWTAITYTVTFNANDGSQSPATGTQIFTAGIDQALTTAATLGFSRSGYAFTGWATTNDATSAGYSDGQSYTATGNVTLYAVWKIYLASISVTTAPSKVLYFAGSGESLSTDGMVVTATYSNESTATVTGATTSGFDSTSGGIKALTVSYTEDGITKTTTTPYYVAASDALTQTVVSNGTTTITVTENNQQVKKTYDLVKFGDFPQTIAASGITYSSSTVYNGWYLGSDGYFYESCSANPCDSSYTFSNNVTIASGTTYYFKVQPIEWRVLTSSFDHDKNNGTNAIKLLLAEKNLTANVPYYGATSERTLNGTTIYANNYKYSNIRAYLNGTKNQFVLDGGTSNDYTINWETNGFLKKAFTTSAQNLIPATAVDNSARSTNTEANASQWNNGENTYACADTSDKIFLLSEQEVTTSTYGFAEYTSNGAGSARIRVTTDYAKANNAFQDTTSGYGGYWWLRSPSYFDSSNMRLVGDYGNAGNSYYVNLISRGVCPALSISFE